MTRGETSAQRARSVLSQIKTMPLFTTFLPKAPSHHLSSSHMKTEIGQHKRCWAQLQSRHCGANACQKSFRRRMDPLKQTMLWWQSYVICERKKTLYMEVKSQHKDAKRHCIIQICIFIKQQKIVLVLSPHNFPIQIKFKLPIPIYYGKYHYELIVFKRFKYIHLHNNNKK